MGKPKTLKSSLKTIQQVISNFNPVALICLQQSRTHSFRAGGLYPGSSHNSVYYTPRPASMPCSSSVSFSPLHYHPPLAGHTIDDDDGKPSTNSSTYNLTDDPVPHPTGPMNSRRFFFSPRTTESIMEEDKSQRLRHRRIKSCGDPQGHGLPGVGADRACFCEENFRLVMSTQDPYEDFRTSMVEMVETHGLHDCSELQQLLHCYLSLNDRKTHNIIMLAFIDMFIHSPFVSSSQERHHDDNGGNSSVPCPYPLAQFCFK